MMQPNQSQTVNSRTRASLAVCMMMFGVFLLFPGVTLTAVGNSNDDEFFEPSHKPMRIIGPILLSIGLALICTSACLCYVTYKSEQQRREEQRRQPLPTGPIVSGYTPAPIGQQYPGACPQAPYAEGSGYQSPMQPSTQQPNTQYGAPAASYPSYSDTSPNPKGISEPSAPPPSYDSVIDQHKSDL